MRAPAVSLDGLRAAAAGLAGVGEASVRLVWSPYRICPIGAHVDHQHGPVLGLAIDRGTGLAFAPSDGARCRFASRNEAGEAAFDVARPGPAAAAGWERYPKAAAWALRERLPARPRGVAAVVAGDLPGGGLSSSASLLLACLTALAHANDLALTPAELVRLSFAAENGYVGLKSGVLDPAAIVAARRGRLACIDTAKVGWESLALGAGAPAWRALIAYGGVARNLTGTDFNRRVDECREAARLVAARVGLDRVDRLGDLPESALDAELDAIPGAPGRRARHFHEERRRVRAGAACWQAGDLAGFGRLMSDSCRSSIESYETGSPELVALHRALEDAGAFGSRFSGGGFGGCAIGLVAAERAETCRDEVADAYARAFPAHAARASVFVADSDDGVRIV
ncbi:MAG TPA: galactokinase family protein [Myxococcota bacterium]|nr:galactokinase family protein [Myxococcota bacterium]